jgi:hypothetical protein
LLAGGDSNVLLPDGQPRFASLRNVVGTFTEEQRQEAWDKVVARRDGDEPILPEPNEVLDEPAPARKSRRSRAQDDAEVED